MQRTELLKSIGTHGQKELNLSKSSNTCQNYFKVTLEQNKQVLKTEERRINKRLQEITFEVFAFEMELSPDPQTVTGYCPLPPLCADKPCLPSLRGEGLNAKDREVPLGSPGLLLCTDLQ